MYKHYGGRGIKVCDRWSGKDGFNNFLEDMGMRPVDKTLDRFPDMNGDYTLENCRWATDEEQRRNMRSNVWVEYGGERLIMADMAKKLGVDYKRFSGAIKRGRSVDFILYQMK